MEYVSPDEVLGIDGPGGDLARGTDGAAAAGRATRGGR
jgi:hypothetical protein